MTKPIPTRNEIAENETLVEITGDTDSLGRARFHAYWLDSQTPTGIRGQVFFDVPGEFIRAEEKEGRSVRRWSPDDGFNPADGWQGGRS